jgi:hypothetical protein
MKTISISQWVAAAVKMARGVHAASTSAFRKIQLFDSLLSGIRELKRTGVVIIQLVKRLALPMNRPKDLGRTKINSHLWLPQIFGRLLAAVRGFKARERFRRNLTLTLSPRRGKYLLPRWRSSQISECFDALMSFSLSPGERAGVRASVPSNCTDAAEVRAPLLALALVVLFTAFTASAQVNLTIGTLPPGGVVTLTFDVIINTPFPANTFSVSNQAILTATGVTLNSDDPVTALLNDPTVTQLPADLDFGDAPAPYPTLLASDGARHIIPFGGATLYLGTVPPDAEADGQPNATATGDNIAGMNDEDGVTFPTSFRGGLSSNITVTVTGSGGLLNAWIDWNHDGDWNDAGEQVCTNRAVSAGVNVIAILAPGSDTVSAGSFARFRLSSQSNLLLTGQAPDGEVEDYAVTLVANTPPVAVNDTLGTLQNRAVSMTASKLAANDTDADGDALTVSAVSATSTNGGSVVLASGTITYTPLPALAGTDRFPYTVSDGRGGTSVGTVVVTVTSSNAVSLNVVYGPLIDGTDFVVRFAGFPGEAFTVEATDTLSPAAWVKKTNLTAPTSPGAFGIGVFEFRENKGGATQRFYRTVYPSY